MACILCVKNSHSKCKDEYLIEKASVESKVEFIKSDFDHDSLMSSLGTVLDQQLYKLNNDLTKKK